MQIQALATAVLLVVLACAAWQDLARHRIPNSLNLTGLLLGLALAGLSGGLTAVAYAAAGVLVGFGVLLPFYLLRGMGAGDVKLMAAAGAFLGPGAALLAAALTLVTGAVLGIAIVCWRIAERSAEPRGQVEGSAAMEVPAIWRALAAASMAGKERFPYAVAIAVGVMISAGLYGHFDGLFAALPAAG